MSLWWLTPEGAKALAEENRALDESYEREMEYRSRVEPIVDDLERKDALLREALNVIAELGPRGRKQRNGCFFVIPPEPCFCTACKIKRELNEVTE
jgi:hypothetical protein